MRRVSFLAGLRMSQAQPKSSAIMSQSHLGSVALMGADTPGLRPSFQVDVSDHVQAGQCLFVDRADPEIQFVAPLSGKVISADYGPRRTLSAIIIKADDVSENQTPDPAVSLDLDDGQAIRQALLKSGLWPAFRARPFGRIPASEALPSAIVVNAANSALGAPDPAMIIGERPLDFRAGLDAIAALTQGASAVPVHVCQSGTTPLYDGNDPRIMTTQFAGSYLAGLPSSHVYQLAPASVEASVWSIDYQDVLAIGARVLRGYYDPSRVVVLGGSGSADPRLVRTTIGANLHSLISEQAWDTKTQTRVLSGSVLAGREAGFLGRYHSQVSVLHAASKAQRKGWLSRLSLNRARNISPLIANTTMDAILPANVLAVPLMRALAVGDTEAVVRLGALDLVEEDVAPLSQFCPSGADYGALLRTALDDIAQEYG